MRAGIQNRQSTLNGLVKNQVVKIPDPYRTGELAVQEEGGSQQKIVKLLLAWLNMVSVLLLSTAKQGR